MVDELTGGSGFNWLCSSNPMDKLIGVDPPDDTQAAVMYVSSGATNNFNADSDAQTSTSSCGHTSHGSGWGDCGNYTWSSAPSPCANLGLDDRGTR